MKVLFVDDAEVMHEQLTDLISKMRIGPIEIIGKALTKKDAEGIIIDRKPDVVILDMRLDGDDGLDLAPLVKRMNPGAMVVVLTNFPTAYYRSKCCKENGVDYFFTKSSGLHNITAALTRFAEGNLDNDKFSSGTESV